MTTRSQLIFSDDRLLVGEALGSLSGGHGWCNVVACVEGDVPDLKINLTGLWVSPGVAGASYVTSPPRRGVTQPASLGVVHSRGRLGAERIRELVRSAPFVLRQDHRYRGVLLDVPPDTPESQILDVMCNMTVALCDYESTGQWRMDLFVRE